MYQQRTFNALVDDVDGRAPTKEGSNAPAAAAPMVSDPIVSCVSRPAGPTVNAVVPSASRPSSRSSSRVAYEGGLPAGGPPTRSEPLNVFSWDDRAPVPSVAAIRKVFTPSSSGVLPRAEGGGGRRYSRRMFQDEPTIQDGRIVSTRVPASLRTVACPPQNAAARPSSHTGATTLLAARCTRLVKAPAAAGPAVPPVCSCAPQAVVRRLPEASEPIRRESPAEGPSPSADSVLGDVRIGESGDEPGSELLIATHYYFHPVTGEVFVSSEKRPLHPETGQPLVRLMAAFTQSHRQEWADEITAAAAGLSGGRPPTICTTVTHRAPQAFIFPEHKGGRKLKGDLDKKEVDAAPNDGTPASAPSRALPRPVSAPRGHVTSIRTRSKATPPTTTAMAGAKASGTATPSSGGNGASKRSSPESF